MNDITIPPGVNLIVVGDLHGQLEDLVTILDKNGVPSHKTWFLFNGDYVDRGAHGVEVIILILAFKLLYPDYVFLNRGNHEERMINENFGFEDEIYTKYSTESVHYDGAEELSCSTKYSCVKLFQMFEDVFCLLPLFSLVNDRVFVTHGGLSSHENVTIDELRSIKHHREVPTQGTSREDELFTHLLWSDPRDIEGYRPSERGAGVEFGPDITKKFCELNELSLVIRSHECEEEGYEITHDGLLLTIFSASSYCGSQTNKGAFVQLQVVENGNLKPHVVQYYGQPLQKLRDAGRNEWRKKASRLERRTMMSLVELICEKKSALAAAFSHADADNSGRISKLDWRDVLKRVLGIEVKFLSYFHQLVGKEADAEGFVDYAGFLNRYAVEITCQNVDWRRHLLRRVWLAFCEALAEEEGEEPETMTPSDKLQAAFNLFQTSSRPTSKASPTGHPSPVAMKSIPWHCNSAKPRQFVHKWFGNVRRVQINNPRKLGLADSLSEQQILELMQHMDQKRDGFVDFEEFCSFFAEFTRLDYLQELFDLDDVRAIDLLQQFGSHLNSCHHFVSLRDAFESMDTTKSGVIRVEDLQSASKQIHMVPPLDEANATMLFEAILRTHYGVQSQQSELTWAVFVDVFSPDSVRQRNLWMSSRSLSPSKIRTASEDCDITNEEGGPSPLSSPSRHRATWVDSLVDSVKTSLHEQRLHLKFVFRMLDKKKRGFINRRKFVAAMKCVNQDHGSPLKDDQFDRLADAFSLQQQQRSNPADPSDAQGNANAIDYPAFLRSLRVIDTEVPTSS
ncbi:hypothetical protein PINS_up004726 [Pythium insidiosum]|nr:hypothetical protein PINS_up004726 [Pythium insidiosum]